MAVPVHNDSLRRRTALKYGEKLTTASLRTAFGNAVDDPDSQLNKIHTVLLNRDRGDVDTLA